MIRNKIHTISFREIKSSFRRFLTIVLMSMLGVGTFVGLSATAPDMINSLDKYYDNQNFYDIKILSTLGISDSIINHVKKIDGVKDVYGVYSKDVIADINKKDSIVKVISINDKINKIEILNGRLPKEKDEIVVDSLALSINKVNIGDTIFFYDEAFNASKYKIVGEVKSPIFITAFKAMPDRGITNLGNGKILYYAYVLDEAFNLDYYTEMYVTVDGAISYITNSEDYNKVVKKVYDLISKDKKQIENDRYDEIYNEYKSKIDDEKEKNEKELNNAKRLLDQNGTKLFNGKKELDNAKKLLDESASKLESEGKNLEDAKKQLEEFERQLIEGKNKLDSAKEQIDSELKNYNLSYDSVLNLINVLSKDNVSKEDIIGLIPKDANNYNQIVSFIDGIYSYDINNTVDKETLINSIPTDIENYDSVISTINAIYNFDLNNYKESKEDLINIIPKDIDNYDDIVNNINYYYDNTILDIINNALDNNDNIDSIINSIPEELPIYEELVDLLTRIKDTKEKILELENAINEIENGYAEYYKNKALYDELLMKYNEGKSLYDSYLNEYNEGIEKYKSNYKLYSDSLNLYNSKLREYYNARSLFDRKISDAYNELDNIPESILYIYNRLDSSEYSGYIDDSQSIANLSTLFPVVFFIVAILICLVSMSRMVEDDRGLLGTLKSLGFSNFDILKKYLIYSFSATIIGGVVGSILGFYLLSHYIFDMYKLLFTIDKFVIYYDLKYIVLGIIISIICICGTTLITVFKNVKEKPANLLRPKAPPSGKRVILEKIPFVWNRLNFSNKVTARNLFRYKKRSILTIIGIIGCTALLLSGFAIKDSIVNIPTYQYNKVFTFTDMVYLLNDENIDEIFNNEKIKNYSEVMVTTGYNNKESINLFAAGDENTLNYVFKLHDKKTDKELKLVDNEVIITDKISEMANVGVGEYISFTDSTGKEYKFKVSAVCRNYVGHYIVMNKTTYEKLVGKYETNVVLYNLKNVEDDDTVSKEILQNSNIMSVISATATIRQVDNMLKVLDSVVLILIFLSGGLSIVVLYNLSYINISERRREIATLKVLGFTYKEVDNYINKETIILTIIGIVFGLIFGIFLADIIVSTVEISLVRFVHHIEPLSYILTSVIIIIFTLIINFSAHYSLKKIDMIESLKSVE